MFSKAWRERRRGSGGKWRLLAGMAVAGVVFGITGAIYASIPDSSGVIHGCYNQNGALRVIDTSSEHHCIPGEKALNWIGSAQYAYIYDLSPPDLAATVAAGTDVPFAHNGPKTAGITYTANGQITIATAGVYRVEFIASVTEPGQLVLTQNGVEIPSTVYGRATGTSEISGQATLSVTAGDILTLRNPSGNSPALTFTPVAGGTHADVSASILIEQLG
jgi:BclA C-terminal domain